MPSNIAGRPVISNFNRFVSYLEMPVDVASVSLFRILFGLAMLGFIGMYFASGMVRSLYIEPKFFFPFLPFIAPLPAQYMYALFAALGGLAILIALGCFYRVACLLFCLGMTYVLLVEKTHYQNHVYLICLLSFLLAIIPAHRMFSLDQKFRGANWPETIPRWQLFLLRAQVVVVYFFSGISKLNSDWLHGHPLDEYLARASGLSCIAPLILHPPASYLFAYAGIAIDLALGFLLLYKRTFWLGVAIAVFFNLSNSLLFCIDVLPWLMLSTLTIFPDSGWPRNFLSGSDPRVDLEDSQPKTFGLSSFHLGVIFAFVYFVLQALIPLRHFLYPGETSWTEYGHRFSWRMMLRKKHASSFKLIVIDPLTKRINVVNPRDCLTFLTERQAEDMSVHPDMILRFANHVADQEEKRTGRRPIVHVQCDVSLNGRKPMPLIDPNADLAKKKETIFPVSWILPLGPDK